MGSLAMARNRLQSAPPRRRIRHSSFERNPRTGVLRTLQQEDDGNQKCRQAGRGVRDVRERQRLRLRRGHGGQLLRRDHPEGMPDDRPRQGDAGAEDTLVEVAAPIDQGHEQRARDRAAELERQGDE